MVEWKNSDATSGKKCEGNKVVGCAAGIGNDVKFCL